MKPKLSEEPKKLASIVTDDELVDAIWAAIQRPSPAVTRNEIAAMFGEWEGDSPIVKDNRLQVRADNIDWCARQIEELEAERATLDPDLWRALHARYTRQIREWAVFEVSGHTLPDGEFFRRSLANFQQRLASLDGEK